MSVIVLTLVIIFSDGTTYPENGSPTAANVFSSYAECEAAAVELYQWSEQTYPGLVEDVVFRCDSREVQ